MFKTCWGFDVLDCVLNLLKIWKFDKKIVQKVWVGEESRLTIFDSFLREKGAIFQEITSHHDYGKQRLV